MRHRTLALALLLAGAASGAAPSYTADGIVNTGSGTPGPFAPNSILSIYGTNLAVVAQALTVNDIHGNLMPTELQGTQVLVDHFPAPLFYVSPGQINFVVPTTQVAGDTRVQVVTNSVYGPEVTVTVVGAAPALFATPAGYAIATHADNSLITADSPAAAGEIVVVYVTGLGKTSANLAAGEITQVAGQILALGDLQVSIGGNVLTGDRVKYAGVTPGSAGLYQINLSMPDNPGSDPEIRVAIGSQSTPPGLKIPCR